MSAQLLSQADRSDQSDRRFSVARAFGIAIACLGLAVLAGWAFDIAVLKSIVPGLATMKANTALGLALSGTSLALLGAGDRRLRTAAILSAAALALGIVTLIEHTAGLDLRIDELLFDDPATPPEYSPGRMSLAASLGLLFGAAALLLLSGPGRSAARAATASGLGLGVALLGIVALAGYATHLDVLYAWPAFGSVAAHTAAGFAILGTGILLAGRARMPVLTEGLRITGLAASLLALAASATGFAAYSALESAAERNLADGVTLALKARVEEIRGTLESRTVRAGVIATRPNMLRNARLHAGEPANVEFRAVVQGVLGSFMTHGFSGIAVSDGRGERYAQAGDFVDSKNLEAPLGAWIGASLLWKKRFYLRNRLTLEDVAGPLGEVLAEQPLPNLDRALEAPDALGESAELLLCRPGESELRCFPSRLSPTGPFILPFADAAGQSRLARRAAQTGAGYGTALDYRGRRVLGAFAPVGATGLVAVLKVDAAEIYAPLAGRFQLVLVLIAAFAIGGALLVHARVRPLAGALERRVRERTAELQLASDSRARQTERLRIVHEVDSAIISAAKPEDIAATVLQPLRRLLGVARANINLIDKTADDVEWFASAGRHRTHIGAGLRFPAHLIGDVEALKRGEPQRIDSGALPPGRERDALLASGVRYYMAVPMIAAGELIGAVSFGGEEDSFPREQVAIAREVATQLAVAIGNARLHEKVQRLNAELEQRVRERTAELEIANRELESFSYSVSHDLRAPLRAVDGYALMLTEDYGAKLDDEGKRLLGVVRASAAQMGRLIDDLLKFSQVGRKALAAMPVDMHALAAEVLAELSPAYPRARVELYALPRVTGDRALLRHVWANLLHNALKYSAQAAEPRIEIGAEDAPAEATYWVRDNGAGFDMRYYEKLFKVFQRLHREDEFEGTGVGLAIVQRVVLRHGGRAWGEGAVGAGATFRFALPKGGSENGRL